VYINLICLLFCHIRVANYSNEYVCLFVCLFVCVDVLHETFVVKLHHIFVHVAYDQWHKPGPQVGGIKKILPSPPNSQIFGGTARNSL